MNNATYILISLCCFVLLLYWIYFLKAGNQKKLEAQLKKEEAERLEKQKAYLLMQDDLGKITAWLSLVDRPEELRFAGALIQHFEEDYSRVEGYVEAMRRINLWHEVAKRKVQGWEPKKYVPARYN